MKYTIYEHGRNRATKVSWRTAVNTLADMGMGRRYCYLLIDECAKSSSGVVEHMGVTIERIP
jgi:hypothetical protein